LAEDASEVQGLPQQNVAVFCDTHQSSHALKAESLTKCSAGASVTQLCTYGAGFRLQNPKYYGSRGSHNVKENRLKNDAPAPELKHHNRAGCPGQANVGENTPSMRQS
jgi:hypothetical protein